MSVNDPSNPENTAGYSQPVVNTDTSQKQVHDIDEMRQGLLDGQQPAQPAPI